MSLEVDFLGVRLQNPVFLASGTCGFGAEVLSVTDVESRDYEKKIVKSMDIEHVDGTLRYV